MKKMNWPAGLLTIAGAVCVLALAFIVSSCDEADQPVQAPPANTSPVALTSEITVSVDIKPGSCPNPVNLKSKGVLPVAVAGTADFDVAKIDRASLKLAGVAPLRWSMEDVTTPYAGEMVDCLSCDTAGPDGYMDLTLKFKTQDIVAAIGATADGECVTLVLTGSLLDGTALTGKDIVGILKKPVKDTKGPATIR